MYELPKEHYITVYICKQQIIKEQQKLQGLFQGYFTKIEKYFQNMKHFYMSGIEPQFAG